MMILGRPGGRVTRQGQAAADGYGQDATALQGQRHGVAVSKN